MGLRNLADQVAARLRRAGVPFQRDVVTKGLRVDFLIRTPDRKTIAIEVRTWGKHDGFRSRAAHQASLVRQVAGVDTALIVVESLERSRVSKGVVNPSTVVAAVRQMYPEPLSRAKSDLPTTARASGRAHRPQIFAAMPFDRKYDDVFFFAMTHAAQAHAGVCERVDTVEYSGDIVAEIQKMIRRSDAVIADLSESNPNVLYEAGFAHALGVPTIHISSTPLSQLPFDVAHWNTLAYQLGQVHRLRTPLARRLGAALRRRNGDG